jgi:hypothetical protein
MLFAVAGSRVGGTSPSATRPAVSRRPTLEPAFSRAPRGTRGGGAGRPGGVRRVAPRGGALMRACPARWKTSRTRANSRDSAPSLRALAIGRECGSIACASLLCALRVIPDHFPTATCRNEHVCVQLRDGPTPTCRNRRTSACNFVHQRVATKRWFEPAFCCCELPRERAKLVVVT